jgi:hypothetical protein
MPRYKPLGPTLSEENNTAFDAEWRAELKLIESRERFEAAKRTRDLRLSDCDPYGRDSEHSWVRDSAAVLEVGGDPLANERLNRFRSAYEKRAVSTSTLAFISGVVLPPRVAEAVAFGIRSVAPLASALLRLDLPPEGDSALWAKVTTAATFPSGSQSAENAALSASAVRSSAETYGWPRRRLANCRTFRLRTPFSSSGSTPSADRRTTRRRRCAGCADASRKAHRRFASSRRSRRIRRNGTPTEAVASTCRSRSASSRRAG